MKNKDRIYKTVLFVLPIIFVGIVSTYSIFGSNLDWLNQHVAIADYFRQNFYKTHQLIPDAFNNLQASTNAFSFSYYGMFRPDILISYLFPTISMTYFVVGYSTLLWSSTGVFCFEWLKNQGYKQDVCFFTSLCCICANCFYQAHQQIMFVEILPFLFLSLICIDKHKEQWISICIFMAFFHNYFYTPGMILMILLYNYYVHHNLKEVILPICFGVFMASILWLPTGLLILQNKKSVVHTNFMELFLPKFKLKGLVYDSYGCGLTVISWLALFQGLQFKKTRRLSILLICMFIFPVFSYILNGTLYARSKILVLCLPFVLMIMAYWLCERKLDKRLLLISCIFLCTKTMFLGLCISLLFVGYYFIDRKECLMLYTLIPVLVFVGLNYNRCLDYKTYNAVYAKDKQVLLERNILNQRTADLDHIGQSVNHIYSMDENRASSYTSTSNSLYNSFFYDVLKNPISQSNRTTLVDSENYVYLSLMGIQNVVVKKDNLYGYAEVDQQGKYKLLQNKKVFPLAYVTNEVMSEKDFDKLSYPYTLDTLYNRTIVKDGSTKKYISKMKLVKKIDKEYSISNSKKTKKKIPVDFDTKNKMVCIDFDVKNQTNKKVWIQINGIKNTLSKKYAVYPNDNKHFTYVLSKKEWKNLNVVCSKGKYKVSNIRIFTCNMDTFQRKVTPVQSRKTDDVFFGKVNVDNNGYFVTSFPYEKGYSLYVDGKKQDIDLVNKAFVGCKISKGNHTIRIQFHAPGKTIGLYMSLISICIGGFWIWKKSRN